MYDEIDRAFNVRGKPVIFAWGDKIYNPLGIGISPELKVHESVHGNRQGGAERNIRAWWERYLVDPEFRLTEELPAHRGEYRWLCSRTRDRNLRHDYLVRVSAKLASPLYGNLVGLTEARRLLLS